MAKYRQVQVSFWQDSFVLDLTPEEKYFYLYLMTNSKTTQVGIYELPKKIIELETGYNRETVDKLLDRFIDYGKIAYNEQNKEVMILNWARHNWNPSIKIISRVNTELKEVKTIEFLQKYLIQVKEIEVDEAKVQKLYGIDTLSIPYRYKEKEKDKENDKEKREEKKDSLSYNQEVYDLLNKRGIDMSNAQACFKISQKMSGIDNIQYLDKAIDIADQKGVLKAPYVLRIIENWFEDGKDSYAELMKYEKKNAPKPKHGTPNDEEVREQYKDLPF